MSRTAAAFIIASMITTPALAQTYELVWSDEFDGSELDTSSWEYMIGTGTTYGLPAGWGNNELQYYTNFSDNISVSGGMLTITARNENFGGRSYTSARIRTRGMRDFVYGRFEARMKIPSTPGAWPAFWMLPTSSPYGGWASSGEIDIMESVNYADRIYGTIHHGAPWPANQHTGGTLTNGTDFSDDFHVYAIEWEPDQIRWYVDDTQYATLSSGNWYSSEAPGNSRAPFDVPFHLLLNVAVGGDFPGNPNGSSVFPQTLEVDYVRVYQLERTPFDGTPIALPGRIEAEDFDNGANGTAYSDTDSGNNGSEYRDTDVDIEARASGGYNVGWIEEGEWLEYTVDVPTTGNYQITAAVSSESTGGSFRIELEGQDLTGPVSVPVTGGWQDFVEVSAPLQLQAGEQILRFTNLAQDPDGYNLDYLEFTLISAPCADADLAEPYGMLDFFDLSAFLAAMGNQDPIADINNNGSWDFFDLSAYLAMFAAGCP